MARISLAAAEAVIEGALAKGAALELKPLAVAVLDAGGHLIAVARQDGASTLRPQIAIGKAAGALALGISSRSIGEMAIERPTFIAALGAIVPAGIVPAAGGVIVVDSQGLSFGAVGVTGDTSDNDEVCALAGVAAASLTAKA